MLRAMEWTLLVIGLLVLWGTWRFALGYPRPARRYRQLAPREAALVAAAADAVFPPGGAIEPSASEAGVEGYVDAYLDALPGRNRILIRLLFVLFEHATLLFPAPGWAGWRRFSALDAEQRAALLESWGRSRLRLRRIAFASLRTILTMGYLGSPAVLRAMGLAPLEFESPVVDADLLYPRIGEPRDSIRFAPEDRRAGPSEPLDPHGPLHPDYAGEAP